jgi:ABC-type antimicrobial peptide transport system permease subunit
VANIFTQKELVERHTIRERLLAVLSFFFATIALALAGVGLYGVLNYSVVQRRREIGIRLALGARPVDVARRVTAQIFAMLVAGSAAGLAAGLGSERFIQTLLYQVSVRDLSVTVIPALTIAGVALLAAIPPVIRAVRIDPAVALRTD